MLSSIFQRLQRKEDPFQVFMAASDAEIEQLWNILSIDNMLTQKDTTKKALKAKKKMTELYIVAVCDILYLGSKSVQTLVASCANLYECHMISSRLFIFFQTHLQEVTITFHLKSFMAYLQLREIGLH